MVRERDSWRRWSLVWSLFVAWPEISQESPSGFEPGTMKRCRKLAVKRSSRIRRIERQRFLCRGNPLFPDFPIGQNELAIPKDDKSSGVFKPLEIEAGEKGWGCVHHVCHLEWRRKSVSNVLYTESTCSNPFPGDSPQTWLHSCSSCTAFTIFFLRQFTVLRLSRTVGSGLIVDPLQA